MKLRDNRLVAFGQHLLKHLDLEYSFTDEEWDFIMTDFDYDSKGTVPGLMYLNWVVAHHYNREPLNVRYRKTGRKGEDVLARQVAFYVAASQYNYGPSEIAEFYGDLNHASVIHGRDKIKKLVTGEHTDNKLKQEVEDIIYKLKGYFYDISNDERTDTEASSTDVSETEIDQEDS